MIRGKLFYDASCGLCTAGARRWDKLALRAGFEFVPLQSDAAVSLLHLAPGEIPSELKLATTDARILGGIDAILHVARHFWWAWPLWLLGHTPGIHAMLKAIYRLIARRRHRISAACRLGS